MATKPESKVKEYREWKRKHPDFPLTVHPVGQWSKKVLGKVHYFGPLGDPDAALRLWNSEKDYLLAGEEPPGTLEGLTIGVLCDAFNKDADDRHERGELSAAYLRDLKHASAFLREHFGRKRLVKTISPASFTNLRQAVADTGRKLRSQKNLISSIRAIFKWAVDTRLLEGEVHFGPRFKAPSTDAMNCEREASGHNRFIDRDAILAMLEHAKPKMKAMILLGINCGFYAGDTIALTFDRLRLDSDPPYHDMARVKNGRRRVAVLWPETVAALRDYIENHREQSDSNVVFLAQGGHPYNGDSPGRALRTSFCNLLKDSGVKVSKGTNLGSLRHTYGTVVDLVPDQKMIDLTMGHTNKSLQKRVYSQLNIGELNRLKVVAETVRAWLYAKKDGENQK